MIKNEVYSQGSKSGLQLLGPGLVMAFLAFAGPILHEYITDLSEFFSLSTLVAWAGMLVQLAIVVVFMRLTGRRWRDYGLYWPFGEKSRQDNKNPAWKPWWQVLLYAVIGTVVIMGLMQFVIGPVIFSIDPSRPSIEHLLGLRGNLTALIHVLFTVWITAAFFEEMIFRGYMMNELIAFLGNSWLAKIAVALLIGVAFGLAHAYQGLSGMLMTGSIGFLMNLGYLLVGRNLWIMILIHGILDTVGLVSLYNA